MSGRSGCCRDRAWKRHVHVSLSICLESSRLKVAARALETQYHDGNLTCSHKPSKNAFYDKSGRGGAQSDSDTIFMLANHYHYAAGPAGSLTRCATKASEDAGKDNNHSQTTSHEDNEGEGTSCCSRSCGPHLDCARAIQTGHRRCQCLSEGLERCDKDMHIFALAVALHQEATGVWLEHSG